MELITVQDLPFTVQFYKRIRRLNSPSNYPQEIGINFSLPFAGLKVLLHEILESLFTKGTILQYPSPGGETRDKDVLAELLNLCARKDIFKAEDVILTNGSSEGIDFTCRFLSQVGFGVSLPLPGYFKYQYVADSCGIPIQGFYNLEGEYLNLKPLDAPSCLFVNSPEAITGKFLSIDFIKNISHLSNASFYLYDLCYLMLDTDSTISTRDFVSDISVTNSWKEAVLLLSVSKDISLPALRAGMLVTKNQELLNLAKSEIMGRYFSISSVCTYIMMVYLSLCAIWYADKKSRHSVYKQTVYLMRQCNLNLPSYTPELVNLFIDYLSDLLFLYKSNFKYIYENYTDIFDICNSITPQAGFSALLKTNWINPGLTAIENISDILSRKQLNIYPSYLFCGDPTIWEKLYPSKFHLRVNASTEREKLVCYLDSLRISLLEIITGLHRKN